MDRVNAVRLNIVIVVFTTTVALDARVAVVVVVVARRLALHHHLCVDRSYYTHYSIVFQSDYFTYHDDPFPLDRGRHDTERRGRGTARRDDRRFARAFVRSFVLVRPRSSSFVMTPERCASELRDMATGTSPIVRFMIEKLADAGCAIDERFFKIERCSSDVVGGFRPPDGIVLCHNQIHDRTTMENTVAHELIHAYDQCRAGKRMNWSDVRQHACSEVRAANLSGDCHWVNEVMRGKVFAGLKGHHRKCARRRAELSVAMNPKCRGAKHAEEIVGEVFERCFNDTAPFDDIT